MKRKNVYVVLIAGMFLLVSIASFLVTGVEKLENSCRIKYLLSGKSAANFGGDRLDQQQTECNNEALLDGWWRRPCTHGYIIHKPGYGFYQLFVPDIHAREITRVSLYVAKIEEPPGDLGVAIRGVVDIECSHDSDETYIKLSEEVTFVVIPSYRLFTSYQWIEFDFPDILVNRSFPYYSICVFPTGDLGCDKPFPYYSLGCYKGRDLYDKGSLFYAEGGINPFGYIICNPVSDSDLTFKTYAKMKNDAPDVMDLYGPTSSKRGETCSYSAVADDPEGDQIYYLFDWGDGTNTGWIGPYPSGKPVSASHTWFGKGDFQIYVKAKDDFGEDDFGNKGESDWYGPLTVHVTKRSKNIMFSWMLMERFPQLRNLILLINKFSLWGDIV